MIFLFFLPFALQTLAIVFDEFYFHHKRGLPKWERIGHPIDTLSVLACFAIVLFVPFDSKLIPAYAILSFFSCLLVTKDEFVHKEHCTAEESWLHSLLFINHPIVLILLGFFWPLFHEQPSLLNLFEYQEMLEIFVQFQAGSTLIFFLYQVIYWNFYVKETDQQRLL